MVTDAWPVKFSYALHVLPSADERKRISTVDPTGLVALEKKEPSVAGRLLPKSSVPRSVPSGG